MKRILFAALLLPAGFATAARADAPAIKADIVAKAVTVPFELLRTGHMTVQVKVNGKGPYKLIFDTGAPITLLNNKIAKEAGLLKGMARPLFAPFGSMGDVKVKELQVGDQKAADVTAIVMDHPTVEAISRAFGPIDGIVGFPFFARFKMTLDYQAKTMTFVPNGFKPPDVMKAMSDALMAAAVQADDGPRVLSSAAQWGMLVKKDAVDEADGVTITAVLPGGAAAAAGLKAGDRLLTLDGRWTDSLADLYAAAGYVKPGATAPVVVKRGGKEVELTVKPAAGL
jgi:membrane-associated protease RseP (regulator of RpoE activity)